MSGATLIGRIYSDKGPPVGNILVAVQPVFAAPTGLVTYPAITDGQGRFTVTVPAGAYSVCAGAPNQNLLNSCEWSPAQSVVHVPLGATAAQSTLILVTGVAIAFRIGDSAGLLPRPGTAAAVTSSTPTIQFGLWDSGGSFHLVPQTSGDDQGITFQTLVPPNAKFRLTVQGSNVQLNNQNGDSLVGSVTALSSSPTAISQPQVFQASPVAVTSPVTTPTTPTTTTTNTGVTP